MRESLGRHTRRSPGPDGAADDREMRDLSLHNQIGLLCRRAPGNSSGARTAFHRGLSTLPQDPSNLVPRTHAESWRPGSSVLWTALVLVRLDIAEKALILHVSTPDGA